MVVVWCGYKRVVCLRACMYCGVMKRYLIVSGAAIIYVVAILFARANRAEREHRIAVDRERHDREQQRIQQIKRCLIDVIPNSPARRILNLKHNPYI